MYRIRLMDYRSRSKRRYPEKKQAPIKRDIYGFRKEYDRTRDYTPNIRGYRITSNQIKKWFKYFCIIVLLSIIIISGSHAWSAYPDDMFIIKLMRMWIAIIFSPFYLFYVFTKKTVFKPV